MEEREYHYLDRLTKDKPTDKGSQYHDYTRAYAAFFAPLKYKAIKFLEIGIGQCGSVKLWEEYFPNAELHFIDFLTDYAYISSRSHYHLANQESADELNRVMCKTGGNFDVIIDDGGHTPTQQITSFTTLFPHVKSGGLYIIEDLLTSYWVKQEGLQNAWLKQTQLVPNPAQYTMIDLLKELVDRVNYVGHTMGWASHERLSLEQKARLPQEAANILSITFYDSFAAITKR